jgi:hypothetical protein
METRRCVEFTGVELAGGVELAALVEKAVAGERSDGDAGRQSGGTVERETQWRVRSLRKHDGAWSWSRGDL